MRDYFWRLSTIDPDVTELLLGKPAPVQRRIAAELAHIAVSANGLGAELAGAARAAGREARAGGDRERVGQVAAGLDRHEDELQDRFDADQATEEEYLVAFRRARAAHCVLFALDEDPQRAVLEAAYEANAAGVPVELIREAINLVGRAPPQ